MFYRTVLLAAVALTGAVNAQSRNETGTGPEIDPNSVPISERQGWCRIQTQNCPRICGGRTSGNTCDPVSPHVKFPVDPSHQLTIDVGHLDLLLHLRRRQQPQHLRLRADSPCLRLPRVHRAVRRRTPRRRRRHRCLPRYRVR